MTIVRDKIRYIALGDSYTICEGVQAHESWSTVLTGHLKEIGADIELVVNPSVTGFTTQNLIDKELPIFNISNPSFATLLIGVNDWVQKVDNDKFRSSLNFIIDTILEKLVNKKNLLLITIPDFSATPNSMKYSGGKSITNGIAAFNSIIEEEATKRHLQLVDIFSTSQQMKDRTDLVSLDGLHPSAKEYTLWEKLIFPVAASLLLSPNSILNTNK